jgi:hypothetical protein
VLQGPKIDFTRDAALGFLETWMLNYVIEVPVGFPIEEDLLMVESNELRDNEWAFHGFSVVDGVFQTESWHFSGAA